MKAIYVIVVLGTALIWGTTERSTVTRSLPRLTQGYQEHLELLKKELNYAQWASRLRSGKEILAASFDPTALLTGEIKCVCRTDDESEATYYVQCSRAGAEGQEQKMA